jgi:adenylate cyclase
VLVLRRASRDRHRVRELLPQVSDIFVQRRVMGAERPILDVYVAWETAEDGDRDAAIAEIRNSVRTMTDRGQIGYGIPAFGALVEILLERGTDIDFAEAQAAIAGLESAAADGSVIRDVWLLRMRALLAHAGGDESGYQDYRERYRAMASSLGFEGHIAWAQAMP